MRPLAGRAVRGTDDIDDIDGALADIDVDVDLDGGALRFRWARPDYHYDSEDMFSSGVADEGDGGSAAPAPTLSRAGPGAAQEEGRRAGRPGAYSPTARAAAGATATAAELTTPPTLAFEDRDAPCTATGVVGEQAPAPAPTKAAPSWSSSWVSEGEGGPAVGVAGAEQGGKQDEDTGALPPRGEGRKSREARRGGRAGGGDGAVLAPASGAAAHAGGADRMGEGHHASDQPEAEAEAEAEAVAAAAAAAASRPVSQDRHEDQGQGQDEDENENGVQPAGTGPGEPAPTHREAECRPPVADETAPASSSSSSSSSSSPSSSATFPARQHIAPSEPAAVAAPVPVADPALGPGPGPAPAPAPEQAPGSALVSAQPQSSSQSQSQSQSQSHDEPKPTLAAPSLSPGPGLGSE
ncbi:hypothetical protein KEM52_001530 [Ascosphaera acerosa]|nr:hypothetical protein KEM52_001530 [Ascosphaera acerosa]